MAELGLTGAVRSNASCTTIADPAAIRPAELVQRRFAPLAPNPAGLLSRVANDFKYGVMMSFCRLSAGVTERDLASPWDPSPYLP